MAEIKDKQILTVSQEKKEEFKKLGGMVKDALKDNSHPESLKYRLYADVAYMCWMAIETLFNYGCAWKKFTNESVASWKMITNITLAAAGIGEAGAVGGVLLLRFKDMLDDMNKGFNDRAVAEIISSLNRSTLILEQHAD